MCWFDFGDLFRLEFHVDNFIWLWIFFITADLGLAIEGAFCPSVFLWGLFNWGFGQSLDSLPTVASAGKVPSAVRPWMFHPVAVGELCGCGLLMHARWSHCCGVL